MRNIIGLARNARSASRREAMSKSKGMKNLNAEEVTSVVLSQDGSRIILTLDNGITIEVPVKELLGLVNRDLNILK
jgi:hypothetical protein